MLYNALQMYLLYVVYYFNRFVFFCNIMLVTSNTMCDFFIFLFVSTPTGHQVRILLCNWSSSINIFK